MKFSSILRYSVLAIFNAGSIYLIPLIITFESWFLLTVLVFVTFLINFTYLTDKFAALKWITPGVIFMFSFVVFPAAYNTYVSFTNWSTGHILTKSQAIDLLEARTYTPDDQKGVEFDIYIFENNSHKTSLRLIGGWGGWGLALDSKVWNDFDWQESRKEI